MKHIQLYEDFLNESSAYKNLNKFLSTTLRKESEGYSSIFTSNTLSGNKLTGYINHRPGNGSYERKEVEKQLQDDKEQVDKRLKLLAQAIDEFNKENNTNLVYTYKLTNPKIEVAKYAGNTVYTSETFYADVTITQK